MSGAIFAIAALAWLGAAVGFGIAAIAWFGVARLAPAGQKLAAALELGFLNFPAVERRLGEKAGPLVRSYRRGFVLFAVCVGVFFVLTLVNIVGGNAV